MIEVDQRVLALAGVVGLSFFAFVSHHAAQGNLVARVLVGVAAGAGSLALGWLRNQRRP